MTRRYLSETFTPAVLAAQRAAYGRDQIPPDEAPADRLGPAESAFIAARDSFYMATVSETGWPYVQHRGGDPGFVRVLDEATIAFGDLAGNRQLLSVGHLAGEERVSLFFMDYVGRRRLKVLGRARIVAPDAARIAAVFGEDPAPRQLERIVLIEIVGFDWNCPKHITPRYTLDEVKKVTAGLKARIAELEAALGKA